MSWVVSPNQQRVADDFEVLSSFRNPGSPGWTRRVFSDVDRRARGWVASRMKEAGLEVEIDAAANIVGRLPGGSGERGAIVTGSHTDTVEGGGRFDGIVGVLGGLEVARCLREAGAELKHDLVVVDFLGEEPNDFGLSCIGSRAIAGSLSAEHLALVGPGGSTLGQAIQDAGGDIGRLPQARWGEGSVHCFVELHIEQGPVLERASIAIGVVTGIVGIYRLLARISGRPDHAGTTPMGHRRDALLGAAEMALAIERLAEGGVATTGRLEIQPGAHNVVPGDAALWAEARSDDERWLEVFARRAEEELVDIGTRRHLQTSLDWISREQPVVVTDWVAAAIGEAAADCHAGTLLIPSGAGHDASYMARLGPMGMMFVPSKDGRSHCPEEWTDLDQVVTGVAVLAEAVQRVDWVDG